VEKMNLHPTRVFRPGMELKDTKKKINFQTIKVVNDNSGEKPKNEHNFRTIKVVDENTYTNTYEYDENIE